MKNKKSVGETVVMVIGAIWTICIIIYGIYLINSFFDSVFAFPIIVIGIIIYIFSK